MSDWITNLGLAYGPGRAAGGLNLRLVLIGAILPDAGTPLVVLANNLHVHTGPVEAYCQPLQAPLPTLLLAASLALLMPTFGRSFRALFLGVLVHYILDLTQVRYGGGIYVAYPVSFWHGAVGLYWPESMVNLVLLALGAVGLGWALVAPGPRLAWRWHRLPRALLPALVALGLPVFTCDAFFRENVNNVDFFRHPDAYAGELLHLGKLELARAEPTAVGFVLTVRKGDRYFRARARTFERWGRVSTKPPRPGQRLSFRSRYRDGTIDVEGPVHVHLRPLVTWTSLAGLAVLLVILILPRTGVSRPRPAARHLARRPSQRDPDR